MLIITVIIEKEGNIYTAKCPNLIGVSVTANTREEVESRILEVIDNKIKELNECSRGKTEYTFKPVDESISCTYTPYDDPERANECRFSARKDGLCWIHWRSTYGHAVGNRLNVEGCPLCGENDLKILKRWDSSCSFKAEYSNWKEVLEERKKTSSLKKYKEKVKTVVDLPQRYFRCLAIKKDGKQCVSPAQKEDYCNFHWELKHRPKIKHSRFR